MVTANEDAPTRPAMQGETRVGAMESNLEGIGTMIDYTRPWEDCTMTVQYMGPAEVAAYVSRVYSPLTPETVRSYAAKGRMPEPDVRIGPNAGWSESTIDAWWANRPGRGARTDLAASKGK